MNKLALTFLLTILCVAGARADKTVPYSHTDSITVDQPNFATVSFITLSPQEMIYSTLGHSSLRLESPFNDLDVCCSLEVDVKGVSVGDFIKFFAGRANAHMYRIPTDMFVDDVRKQGREINQYELNLTLEQKQRLWQAIDIDASRPPHRRFTYLRDNCTSVLLVFVNQTLAPERFEFQWPEHMRGTTTGQVVRHATRMADWNRFLCMTLLGTEADASWPREQLVAPESLPWILEHARIVSPDGSSRPAIVGKRQIIPATHTLRFGWLTPMVAFGILFAITLILTVLDLLGRAPKWVRRFDIVLLVFQTIAGLLLMWMSFVSGLFGVHWNWYLLVFNPVPALLWLTCRKRPWYRHVYLCYTIVLLLVLLGTPLSEQFDLEHQLITAAFALRTGSYALRAYLKK